MAKPKLTIGCAHHSDWHGLYFSLMSLRLHHSQFMKDVEFVVIDNSPHGPEAPMIQRLLENCKHGTAGTKYVPMPDNYGTSVSRNQIFKEASGEYVLVLDCHVLLFPGALQSILDYYDKHPSTDNLLSGPLVMDNLQGICTHYDNVWRAEMWGIWGRAWKCGCGPNGIQFATREQDKQLALYSLEMDAKKIEGCGACGKEFPQVGYGGHETYLIQQGFKPLGFEDSPPFDIPGMGLGLFSCRKDAWLGFNEFARGFGGEELYIHEKFRKAGRRCLCIPQLKWLHRFARPEGVKYPLTRFNKIRNYVLEFNELKRSLAEVKEHFVDSGLFGKDEWEKLVADPINAVETQPQSGCGTCGGASGSEPLTVEEAFETATTVKRDLDEHLPVLRQLASQTSHITEISGRRESAVAFLAARPKTFVSHNTENSNGMLSKLTDVKDLTKWVRSTFGADQVPSIDETELLFLDDKHTYEAVSQQLDRYAPRVSKYIVLHDTEIFGQRGEDGKQGLQSAIEDFVNRHSNWFIKAHTSQQYGLTVLGRQEQDQPDVPVHLLDLGVGPGTELKNILANLGFTVTPQCDCNMKARAMDYWGVDGCKQHRERIIKWLRDGQDRWGLKDKFGAATKALKSGLAFKLNWKDPYPGLVDESIKRAEQKEVSIAT